VLSSCRRSYVPPSLMFLAKTYYLKRKLTATFLSFELYGKILTFTAYRTFSTAKPYSSTVSGNIASAPYFFLRCIRPDNYSLHSFHMFRFLSYQYLEIRHVRMGFLISSPKAFLEKSYLSHIWGTCPLNKYLQHLKLVYRPRYVLNHFLQ